MMQPGATPARPHHKAYLPRSSSSRQQFYFPPIFLSISTEAKPSNSTMAPIRVGFIGLSSSGWAKGAHFPFLKESDKYEIVAICNSSVESAREAIKSYELPSTTKAYGDPEGKSSSFSPSI
jgi:hypothetical protein